MYSNVASNFIMSFVSPTPSFPSDNESGSGMPLDDANIKTDYGNGHGGGGQGVNITAFLACKFPNISTSEPVTSVKSIGGLPGSQHHYNHKAETTGSPSLSYNSGDWEGTGNRDDWTIGGVARHPGADDDELNNNYYNNYEVSSQYELQHHQLNKLHHVLSAISDNYNDDDGGGETYCPRDWDDILCWPKTAAGEIATLPCFENLHGIPYNVSGLAKRLCMEGGIWNRTEYSGCKPFTPLPNITTDTGNLDITTGIYLFGYCLSLVALIIAAAIFISFKELRCLRNTIHSHLMVTYVLADALWVLSVISTDQGRTAPTACFTFILLHYFHLTNFFWMFVEGLYLYVLVVQTFMTETIRLRTYCLIGWGLPLLIVSIWSVTKWITLDERSYEPTRKLIIQMQQAEEAEFTSVPCPWLHANPYDWIYIASALLVLAANLIFLLRIMWVLITKLRSATSQETQQSRKAAKALVVLMPLLGITYVLVLIGPKKWPLFEHTRAFFLSTQQIPLPLYALIFQGFLVALLYCFLNAEVRMAIRHRWNRMDNFGGDLKCCFCCSDSSNQQNAQNLRDWSPRSRTESIRLYTPTPSQHFRKRESSASETTTMTAVGSSSLNNGGGHGVNTVAGNGSTTLITTMSGRRISTTPLRPTAFTEESEMV